MDSQPNIPTHIMAARQKPLMWNPGEEDRVERSYCNLLSVNPGRRTASDHFSEGGGSSVLSAYSKSRLEYLLGTTIGHVSDATLLRHKIDDFVTFI